MQQSNVINHINEYIDAKQILDEIEKRATYSFDYSQDYRGARDRNEEILRELEKRAPMGFQGMRGKKAILDAIEELEKRAIMGFHVSSHLCYLLGHLQKSIPINIQN